MGSATPVQNADRRRPDHAVGAEVRLVGGAVQDRSPLTGRPARALHRLHGRGQGRLRFRPARHGDLADELTLVERAGGRVRVVPGDPRNFKITYPADLVVAEALVAGHA